MEYDADGCYQVDANAHELAQADGQRYKNSATPLIRASGNDSDNVQLETKLSNGVTIYGPKEDVQRLATAVNEIPDLWKAKGQANIPAKDWMTIPLIENWAERDKPGTAKVYRIGPKDRAQIDADFDKLHEQGRMSWSNEPTPSSFPCFVVWKINADGTVKGRTVVDIRALNQISVADAYPVSSQQDILARISGATHISTIDAASFFYQ